MKETYLDMKARHQGQINAFPMMFAFSDKQFNEGMEKLGLKPTDTDKIYSLGGGGFIKKTDSKAFNDMFKKRNDEMEEGRKDYDFALEMFDYELGNHEYNYTWDTEQTLNALGLDNEDIEANEILKQALKDAILNQEQRDDI